MTALRYRSRCYAEICIPTKTCMRLARARTTTVFSAMSLLRRKAQKRQKCALAGCTQVSQAYSSQHDTGGAAELITFLHVLIVHPRYVNLPVSLQLQHVILSMLYSFRPSFHVVLPRLQSICNLRSYLTFGYQLAEASRRASSYAFQHIF